MFINKKTNQSIIIPSLLLTATVLITITNSQCLIEFQYLDSYDSKCRPCPYSCLQCFDSTSCTTCVDQFYLDTTTNFCQKCPFGCMYCDNSSTCITCNDGLYIDGRGNCLPCSQGVSSCSIAVIEQCHDGFFLLGGICAQCLDNCKTCEDFVTCTSCEDSFYLSSNKQECLSCSQNCQICVDSGTCISCRVGFSINSGYCQVQDCSMYDFCVSCSSNGCQWCQKGKYLDSSGKCIQGGSILCEKSIGPYFTNCDINIDDTCATYAQIQYEQSSGNKLPVCLPLSASQSSEYIYWSSLQQSNCLSATCGSAFNQMLQIITRKSYYQIQYHLSIRLYKNPTHFIKITALNSTNQNQISSDTHSISIASQLAIFNQSQTSCSSCPYGQLYLTGNLQSNGYQSALFNISDQNGIFTIKEYVFVFSICSVEHCQICTTGSDCALCVQPYFLQLVKCVTQCDAGFYQYQRYCLLECPSDTFAIQSSYECQACISPCLRCSSENQCLSCVDGYFLEGESCVLKCSYADQFGNVSSRECEPCPNPCETCEAVNSSSVKCLSCMFGYLYRQQSCVFICPVSYYDTFLDSISQCSSCDQECSECYISSDTCSGCTSGYLLYENYCNQTSSCLDGYFISVNNTCSSCQFPCATCLSQSTNCTSCFKGALYQNKCHSSCPFGYFIDVSTIQNITCRQCPTQCSICVSSTVCDSCQNGFYLYQSQCWSSCTNSSFYANSMNNSCTMCQSPCKQCSSATVCLSCLTGYLDGTSCTLTCNTSSYINTAFECVLCPAPCKQCYSQSQCIKCALPHVLYDSDCISPSDCQNLGKYISYTKDSANTTLLYGECNQCTFPCASCSTSSILCSTCVAGYLYISQLKTCVQQCPATYYSSSSECLKCSPNCYECESTSTNCLSCSAGTYLDSVDKKCVATCPDGYYAENQQSRCILCASPCATCYNVYFCKSCVGGIFYNKVCVSVCPSGTIYNSSTNECQPCTDNCLTCSISTSNCSSCISGYFFNSNNNTCSVTCSDGYYPDIYTQACEQCISPCMKCSAQTECLSCVSNYYLEDGKYCVLTCSNQYFADSATMTCQSCNLTICATCSLNANNCTSCAEEYFFDLTSSYCVMMCPSGYYPQSKSRTCKACQFPCIGCTNTTFCTACQTNYKLYLNRCYSSCPVGYYGTVTCQKCPMNCQICSSQASCTKCTSSYYVQNGQCVKICSQGLYKGKQDMTNYDYCLECPSNCLNCIDFTTCLKCTNGFFLFNGLCLGECPILHFADDSLMTCKQCPPNCVSCTNETYCTKCVNSYIYQNQCREQCPSKTYVFNEEQCLDCVSPCDQCLSQYECKTCLRGYLFYQGYCIEKCPSDVWYYPHNNSCSSTCPYNKYPDEIKCFLSGCGGKLVELNKYCLKNCPVGYYVSQAQSCLSCSSNSEICSDLFIADLQVLRSQKLTLMLYFSQQAEVIQSISEINATFTNQNNQIIVLDLSSYQFSAYSLELQYDYEPVQFLNVELTIPYINSITSPQAISQCYYTTMVYYFNNYATDAQSIMYSLGGIIPVLVSALLLVCVLINIVSKTSYFLQLLDFMQLTGACLYLDIQYPQYLQHFLKQLSVTLFNFMPKMIEHYPFTFSSPKYIFHNRDTSITRTHGLTFIIFIVVFVLMCICIAVDKYFKPIPRLIDRIKYRNLNDLFSILAFPLLLFAFSFTQAAAIDLMVGMLIVLITLVWVIFISNLIIQAKQMGDLMGLLSDYEAVSNKLGLMYTPFSYIRRIIMALLFAIFPHKPLAALTLLLIFTILILICLFFYQPFASQITDYVSMSLQFSLIVFIILIVMIGLDIFDEDANRITASLAIVIVSIAMAVGLGWLCYLTFGGMKKFIQNYNSQNEKDTQNCIKEQNGSVENQSQKNKQNDHQEAEYSASNLINAKRNFRKDNIIEELQNDEQSNSNKEEFKHWNDEDQESSQGDYNRPQIDNKDQGISKNGRLPQMLMKKKRQPNQQMKSLQN